MKHSHLTCLDIADPLPILGRKVEKAKPISAQERRAQEVAAFEASDVGTTSWVLAGSASTGFFLAAPVNGPAVTFADVAEAKDEADVLDVICGSVLQYGLALEALR